MNRRDRARRTPRSDSRWPCMVVYTGGRTQSTFRYCNMAGKSGSMEDTRERPLYYVIKMSSRRRDQDPDRTYPCGRRDTTMFTVHDTTNGQKHEQTRSTGTGSPSLPFCFFFLPPLYLSLSLQLLFLHRSIDSPSHLFFCFSMFLITHMNVYQRNCQLHISYY